MSEKKKPKVMYSSDGQGRWWRREWSEQCPEEVFMHDQCQGVKGHRGVHWCYRADGSYCWDDNDDFPEEDGCSGTTPPDHKNYISPVEKQKEYWLNHSKDTEVTDPELIKKLEEDETPEDEDASTNRPIDMDKLREEDPNLYNELQDRIKETDERRKKVCLTIRATSPHTLVCVGTSASNVGQQEGCFEKDVKPGRYLVQFGGGHQTKFILTVPEEGLTIDQHEVTSICPIY